MVSQPPDNGSRWLSKRILLVYILIHVISDANAVQWLNQINRQDQLSEACARIYPHGPPPLPERHELDHLLVNHQHKFVYCYVPKVACTNWKRLLMVLSGKSNATHLSDILAADAHADGAITKLSDLEPEEMARVLREYHSFVMVRHPFERLVSAFRNKLEGDLPSAKYFQARIGRHIVRTYRAHPSPRDVQHGDNVTFREFVRYLIAEGANNASANEHWRAVWHLCHPCAVPYRHVGKYDTFESDAQAVLAAIGAPHVEFPAPKSVTAAASSSSSSSNSVGSGGKTSSKMMQYYRPLSVEEVGELYRVYEHDFKLFGYDLDGILGFDIG